MARYIQQYGKYTGQPPNATIIIDHEDGEPPKDLTVPDDKDWKLGDIIKFSEYRDTRTYIVGENGKLVKNPDYSGSGYLTIPIEITKHFTNAVQHYADHITDDQTPCVCLELNHSDEWIVNNWGQPFPEEWVKILLWYSWGEFERLSIKFQEAIWEDFSMEDSYQKIINFYEGTKKTQASFIIWYNIFDDVHQKFNKFRDIQKLNLPDTWSMLQGSSCYGCNHSHKIITFIGPEEDLERAKNAVNTFYKMTNYEIYGPVIDQELKTNGFFNTFKDNRDYFKPNIYLDGQRVNAVRKISIPYIPPPTLTN